MLSITNEVNSDRSGWMLMNVDNCLGVQMDAAYQKWMHNNLDKCNCMKIHTK